MTTDVYTHPDLGEQEARLARRAAAAAKALAPLVGTKLGEGIPVFEEDAE